MASQPQLDQPLTREERRRQCVRDALAALRNGEPIEAARFFFGRYHRQPKTKYPRGA